MVGIDKIKTLNIDVNFEQLELYKQHIQTVNQVLNLTAIVDDEGIYLKHFYDSLLIEKYLDKNISFCDVGSGAGFPGMVIAIARPDIKVTLIEPTLKRCNFLNEVIALLDLKNVTVLNERAEDAVIDLRESFDVVTARAVAYLDILSELCVPFVKINGLFIAMKDAKGQEELEFSKKALKKLGAEIETVENLNDEIMGERMNILIRKTTPTPLKYPRNYGRIKKTPLSGRKNV